MRRRGITMVYMAIAFPTLVLLTSLGVDYGRVQVAKIELRRCADSAARYAAQGITDSTWLAKAQTAANDNNVDGQTYSLSASDVTMGNWNGSAFVAGGSPSNAVQVTAHRTAAGGNSIPLLFGSILGSSSCDIHASAVAYNAAAKTGSYGLVGTGTISASSGASVDSYDSSAGSYGGTNITHNGSLASNGTITLSGATTKVDGNVYAGPAGSGTVNLVGNPIITGTTANSGGTMSYAAVASPASGTYVYYGTCSCTGGTITMPGGTYLIDAFTMTAGNIIFTGPATIYVNGTFQAGGGTVTAYNNTPGNLKFEVLNSNSVTISSGLSLQADLYGPGCAATIASGASIYGRIVAKSITANGGSIHYDTELPGVGTTSYGSLCELVK